MPKLYIPRLRDKLVLTADWTFPVYLEGRNETLIDYMGYGYGTVERELLLKRLPPHALYRGNTQLPKPFTMPAGTELSVDRIFIRHAALDFESVTFRCKLPPKKKRSRAAVSIRFWAKLQDVNGLEFYPAGGVAREPVAVFGVSP